ncbi:MAG: stage II sporulation protein M [Myxococcota bacterium]
MNQSRFVQKASARWDAFELLLRRLENKEAVGIKEMSAFPVEYRSICRDLSLARARRFDLALVERLNDLALRGHQLVYRPSGGLFARFIEFIRGGFPRAIRAEFGLVVLAHFLFYGGALAVFGLIAMEPEYAYSVLDPSTAANLEMMYDPASEHHLKPREADSDFQMFGFYIRNNVGIGFRTFAGGIFAGVGSLFLLILNGIFLGAVFGHLYQVGFLETLLTFVVGHGSLELTAITFCSAAGLRLGWSWIAPGNYTRLDGLRIGARRALPVLYGATLMLFLAAIVEAFWSSSVLLPKEVKWSVGGIGWALVLAYFTLGGRRGS